MVYPHTEMTAAMLAADRWDAGLTAQIEAMKLLPDTFVYCENFRDGNLYYTQCSGGHSTKAVEQIMYAALPTFFDK